MVLKDVRDFNGYIWFAFEDLDGEEGSSTNLCHGSWSSWTAPAYTVDVVEAVNQVFPLYEFCVVQPVVLMLPSLFHRKKKVHRETKADLRSHPLDKGSAQQSQQ